MTLGAMIKCKNCPGFKTCIFTNLSDDAMHCLDEGKVTNYYKKGQTLFFQGNPSYGIYCVGAGKIKISKIGNDGKESIIRITASGDLLGHRCLFTSNCYGATATALEDSTLCFIDKDILQKTMEKNMSVAMKIIEKLGRDLGLAECKVASLFQKNVRERLAELFITLKEAYGERDATYGWKLNIKLTREEMASMIGVANETLIRFIAEFKDEGLIVQKGKTLYLVDEQKLIKFANLC